VLDKARESGLYHVGGDLNVRVAPVGLASPFGAGGRLSHARTKSLEKAQDLIGAAEPRRELMPNARPEEPVRGQEQLAKSPRTSSRCVGFLYSVSRGVASLHHLAILLAALRAAVFARRRRAGKVDPEWASNSEPLRV